MAKAKVEVHRHIDEAVPPGLLGIIRIAAKATYHSFGYPAAAHIDVTLVDDAEMRQINQAQRNIDRTTDVLSFPMLHACEGVLQESLPATGTVALGDVILSLPRARAQAAEYGHSVARECGYLTVHSVLHLLGYDHVDEGEMKARMRQKEEAVLVRLGLLRRKEEEKA